MQTQITTLILLSLLSSSAFASPRNAYSPKEMLRAINEIRAKPQQCGSKTMPAVAPLKWSDDLAKIAQEHAEDMYKRHYVAFTSPKGITPDNRVKQAHYAGWGARAALAVGKYTLPEMLTTWMRQESTCSHVIMSPDATEMGMVSLDMPQSPYGIFWANYIGFNPAKPTPESMLQAINQVRTKSHVCGGKTYPPAPPLKWNSQLQNAAQAHADYMAKTQSISHYEADGSDFWTRDKRHGYTGLQGAENIASGQMSLSAAMDGWLNSAGHCRNLMNPIFIEVGMGYTIDQDTQYKAYWVQNFGAP